MNIRCIIIEDEPLAVDVIRDFVAKVPFLELAGVFGDALSAMEVLKDQQVDLIFLDIHLPKLKGLDFLSTLKSPPIVIITTAYHEFAVKSYDYGVMDYLLKPIEFNRFMIAINKVLNALAIKTVQFAPAEENKVIYFSVNKKKARVELSSILYIESLRENIKIVTDAKTIISRYPISELEKLLPASDFIRTHRSFIVAKGRIDYINANEVEIAGKPIPIGRSYKDLVMNFLGIA